MSQLYVEFPIFYFIIATTDWDIMGHSKVTLQKAASFWKDEPLFSMLLDYFLSFG